VQYKNEARGLGNDDCANTIKLRLGSVTFKKQPVYIILVHTFVSRNTNTHLMGLMCFTHAQTVVRSNLNGFGFHFVGFDSRHVLQMMMAIMIRITIIIKVHIIMINIWGNNYYLNSNFMHVKCFGYHLKILHCSFVFFVCL
jgi:hypothetical protein